MELFETHFNSLPHGNLVYHEDDNTYEMFSVRPGVNKHINYLTFKRLFEEMKCLKTPMILESGIASHGTYSTYLFNEYVRKYGGFFWSVDINRDLVESHKNNMCPATKLICDDSVSFFRKWSEFNNKADVIYLDSYDLDFYNPVPAGTHGLMEYKALVPVIKQNTLLLIDDTPVTPHWMDMRNNVYNDMITYYANNRSMPGKGMYVINEVTNASLLLHNYQVLYKFNGNPRIK
jgi:hypothetical protein